MLPTFIWPYGGVTPAACDQRDSVLYLLLSPTRYLSLSESSFLSLDSKEFSRVPAGTCCVSSRCCFDGAALTRSTSSSVPQVEITLQDVNDNPPIFPNDILDVTIEENVGDGFKIMQLTATDADEVTTPRLSLLPDGVFLPVFHSAAFWNRCPGSDCVRNGLV